VNVNIKLTKELENTIEKYEKLSVFLKKHRLASPKVQTSYSKDLVKYGTFISQKSRTIPEVKLFLQDRLEEKDLVELIEIQRDKALLITLQVICDIIVHNLSEPKTSPSRGLVRENENLMNSISEHNLRMAKLNREIAKNSLSDSVKRKENCSKSPSPFYDV
jgi:hypothetical protein